MIRLLLAAPLAIALCACASVPQTLALDASSNRGLIVVEATPGRTGVDLPEFSLNIARYSDAENRLEANSFGGWAGVNKAVQGPDGRYWIVAQADPGRYVITSLTHQGYWVACFNGGTRAFTVEPGEVVFLGRLNPIPALLTMAQTLPARTSSYVFAMDQSITIVDADQMQDWQPAVDAFLRASFPNVTAPIVGSASAPVSFNTGWDLTHTSRVCGGYYAPASEATEQ